LIKLRYKKIMNYNSGFIFDIRHFSIHDGPGIRSTIFMKGCPLSCIWCHNPESIGFHPETYVRTNRLNGKIFHITETVGKKMSVEQVMNEIENEIIFYDESKGGVSFSGGEPLSQPNFLKALLKACHQKELHTAIDTSGYASTSVIQNILPYVHLFLFDLKLANDSEHQKYTGVSNQLILKNLEFIYHSGKPIIIRIPLIQHITDTDENLRKIRAILQLYPHIKRVDLLPFHTIAKSKYERFGKNYPLYHADPYDSQKAKDIAAFFSETVETVSIGG